MKIKSLKFKVKSVKFRGHYIGYQVNDPSGLFHKGEFLTRKAAQSFCDDLNAKIKGKIETEKE